MKQTFQRGAAAAALAVFALAGAAYAKAPVASKPMATSHAATMNEVNAAAGMKVVTGKHVRFVTTKGTFEVVLFPTVAPKTVANFIKLANSHFYDGTTFHRVIQDFMAQGGDPLSKTKPAGDPMIGTGGASANIPDEFSPKLKHLTGSLAMAHSSMPNSASSQFYVCFKPQPSLNGSYCVFGQVTKGMEVVEKLNLTQRDGQPVSTPAPDKMLKVTVF